MHEFYEAYYQRLHTLHQGLGEGFADLPLEALDWQPGPSMNSMAVLIVHTAGAERYWIGDVVGQDPSGRVRLEEFKVRGLPSIELQQRLDEVLVHSLSTLQNLSIEDLSVGRHSWRDDETYSVSWALAHALEHTAIHLGHIQVMCDLWRIKMAGSG